MRAWLPDMFAYYCAPYVFPLRLSGRESSRRFIYTLGEKRILISSNGSASFQELHFSGSRSASSVISLSRQVRWKVNHVLCAHSASLCLSFSLPVNIKVSCDKWTARVTSKLYYALRPCGRLWKLHICSFYFSLLSTLSQNFFSFSWDIAILV